MSEINVGKVAMIPLESIVVSERARQEMGDLDDLESNLKEAGLISPLAVKDNRDGTYQLLAGERRLTVLKKNKVSTVPVRIYDEDLTELEMKIIEKSENFFRKDMTWWELDKLTADIHRMQQQIHGVKSPGPSQEGWSVQDTGELIGGMSKASVSQAIRRAEAREAFPELFEKCKTAADASKVLKKMDEALIKQTIAQRIEAQKSEGSLTKLSRCFIVKDFFEGVKDIPDGVMHLVEVDPPYAIGLKETKKKTGESQYQLSDYNEIPPSVYIDGDPRPEHPWRGMRQVFRECYRVMSQHSWLICWFGPEPWFSQIYQAIVDAGFATTRLCGIWLKRTGQSMNPSTTLSNSYETFFYAWKGRPALNKAGRSNIFDIPPVPPNLKTHPTERPVELMKELYETFAFPGSRILIPFLGSGNGIIAAHQLGMSAVGFELGKGYKDSFLVKVNNYLGKNS